MICKYCGQELPDNSKFCIFCGNIIKHPEDMEIPVRVMHTTPTENQFEEYKPKYGNSLEVESLIKIPEVEDTTEVDNIPEIEIINIEKEKEKEPMHHNEEKLKMIQNFDESLNKVVKPDAEEILEGIANKAENTSAVIEEISDTTTDDSIKEITIDEIVEETAPETQEIPSEEPSKEPEIVYLDDNGFSKKFSIDKENKVLNALIVAFGIIVIVLALKTFVF